MNINQFKEKFPTSNTSKWKGYSNEEILKIEKLYNIEVKGELRSFLQELGRGDGGIFGDECIYLYRKIVGVRDHLLEQFALEQRLVEDGHDSLVNSGGTFVFFSYDVIEFYFLHTKCGDDKVLYHDTRDGSVETTGLSLFEFLLHHKVPSKCDYWATYGDLLKF